MFSKIIIAFVTAVFLFSAIAAQVDQRSEIERQVELSKNDLKRPGGQTYDNLFGQDLAPRITDAMKKCVTEKPSVMHFDVVMWINEVGDVSNIYITQASNTAQCLEPTLKTMKFPAPPFAPFHEHIDWKITP